MFWGNSGNRAGCVSCADKTANQKEAITGGPGPALGADAEVRFDQEGIGDKSQERSHVGQGIETVGRDFGSCERKPVLEQRAGGRKQSERQPDGEDEKFGDRPGGIGAGRRAPVGSESNGRAPEKTQEGEKDDGKREKTTVKDDLAANGEASGEAVRVAVAREKEKLEDEDARGPDGGGAAEDGKDLFAEEELHLEEEEGAEKDGNRERQLSPARGIGLGGRRRR